MSVSEVKKTERQWRQTMKRRMIVSAVLLFGLALAVMKEAAYAAETAGITISMTPSVSYGVSLDTAGITMDLGTVSLGATAQLPMPATMTVSGSWAAQEVNVTGQIASAGTPWAFDTSPSTAPNTGAAIDALAAFMIFTSTNQAASPSADQFGADISNTVKSKAIGLNGVTSGIRAGGASGAGERFTLPSPTGLNVMDNLPVGAKRHVWFYFRLPSTTVSGQRQDVMFTLTATAAL